jgi:integrase
MASIQKLLGHASMRTAQDVYSHSSSDMETEAADTMDGIFNPPPGSAASDSAKKIN